MKLSTVLIRMQGHIDTLTHGRTCPNQGVRSCCCVRCDFDALQTVFTGLSFYPHQGVEMDPSHVAWLRRFMDAALDAPDEGATT